MFTHQVLTTLFSLIICFTIEVRLARASLISSGSGDGSGNGFGWLGQNLGGGSASRLFVFKALFKLTFSDTPYKWLASLHLIFYCGYMNAIKRICLLQNLLQDCKTKFGVITT